MDGSVSASWVVMEKKGGIELPDQSDPSGQSFLSRTTRLLVDSLPSVSTKLTSNKQAQIATAVALVFSLALFIFTIAYTSAVFHFETFIGPIGSSVFLTLSSIGVVLSMITLILNCRNKEQGALDYEQ